MQLDCIFFHMKYSLKLLVCENTSRVPYICKWLPDGCRVKLVGSGSGPGKKLSGRFGLGYEKKVSVRVRVEKSAPVQYSNLLIVKKMGDPTIEPSSINL